MCITFVLLLKCLHIAILTLSSLGTVFLIADTTRCQFEVVTIQHAYACPFSYGHQYSILKCAMHLFLLFIAILTVYELVTLIDYEC